jgi:hypothetical protein
MLPTAGETTWWVKTGMETNNHGELRHLRASAR